MSSFRHAGPAYAEAPARRTRLWEAGLRAGRLDPASRRRPDESREPSQRLVPGFHREPWIPAFAGKTIFLGTINLWKGSKYYERNFRFPLYERNADEIKKDIIHFP